MLFPGPELTNGTVVNASGRNGTLKPPIAFKAARPSWRSNCGINQTPFNPFHEQEKTEPSLITVLCLNCGVPSNAEASRPDAKLSFVCDACREKLRQNPQPIPGYQMMRVLGQGGMGSVMLARSERDGRAVALAARDVEFQGKEAAHA